MSSLQPPDSPATLRNRPSTATHRRRSSSNAKSVTVVPSATPPSPSRSFVKVVNAAAHRQLEKYQARISRAGEDLPPQINRRHISVISIGGVIGTGLFIGTATALRHAGPGGTLVGFTITGTVVWSVVVSIGEIVSFLPNVGGPVGLAGLYVDPALAFALGWNAWYNWTIILPTELSAAAILINGFFSDPSGAPTKSPDYLRNAEFVSVSLLLLLAVIVNSFGARGYGEVEFIFSCIKILTIILLIILGLALDFGAGHKGWIGVENWKDPFVPYRTGVGQDALGKFLAVWSVTNQAVFAFFGTEVPGIAAGEVQNAVKNIPRAVRRVWIRIVLFYILAVFVAGLLVPHDDERLQDRTNEGVNRVFMSPFVIALQDSGWKYVYKVANASFVLSAFSAATSDVFISSRLLYVLGRWGHAPKVCVTTYKTRTSVIPIAGIVAAIAVGLLAFMASSRAENVFRWLSAMNSTTALLAWIGILFTYLRWFAGTKHAEKTDSTFKDMHKDDIYANRSRFQPYIAIYAFVMCILVVIFNGWFVFTGRKWQIALNPDDKFQGPDEDFGPWVTTFVTSYLPLPLFFFLYVGYKLIYRSKMVKIEDMTFMRGEIEEPEEVLPKTLWERFIAWLF